MTGYFRAKSIAAATIILILAAGLLWLPVQAADTADIWVISQDKCKYNGESNKLGVTTFKYDRYGFLTKTHTKLEPDKDYSTAYVDYIIKYNDDHSIKYQKRITKQVKKIVHKQSYVYDEDGVLTKIKLDCDHYDLHGKKVFEYEDGLISTVKFYYTYWGEGMLSGWDYTYDGDGRVKTASYLSSSGKKEYTNRFYYDSRGNILKVRYESADGSYADTTKFNNTYKNGRLVKIVNAKMANKEEGVLANFTYKKITVPRECVSGVKAQQKKLLQNASNMWTHDSHGAEGYGINMDFHMRW